MKLFQDKNITPFGVNERLRCHMDAPAMRESHSWINLVNLESPGAKRRPALRAAFAV